MINIKTKILKYIKTLLLSKNLLPPINRRFAADRKNECAYGKVLEVLFSEVSVLYHQTDCLSIASYLFDDMSGTEASEN